MAKEIKTYTAEVFLKEKHNLGESPFYDERTKTLSWVDIMEGKLTNWTPFSSQA
ncbi:MAG: SMP-30/gluconolactonase/LRE family protein [Treponema sp.]|nr:SMP-30/gluconolactonase/LRE family protein [Treponema sp.]MCI7566666.1 SMP-30/gluconolactonase/LRE family protein [Treponema sp.]